MIKSGIAIAVFKKPVRFCIMGSNALGELDVPVVLILALKDFKQQTAVIRDLLTLIQSKGTIQTIYKVSSSEEVYQTIIEGTRKKTISFGNTYLIQIFQFIFLIGRG